MTTSIKITQGSFHQGNIERFGLSAGTQCTCCALFSVTFSIIKNPGWWKSIDIDFVVQSGDKIYKNLNLRAGQYLMLLSASKKHYFAESPNKEYRDINPKNAT